MQTREILSHAPDGSAVVFTQELRPSGWYNIEARTATTADMKIRFQEEEAGGSGSHNTHARLAPSDAKRWTNCTASIGFQAENADRIPPDTGSIYAEEGTRAHDYAEQVLTGKITIIEVPDGDGIKDSKFPDADFRTPVEEYVQVCRSITPEGVTPFVEAQVPLFYDPKSTGTCDFVVVTDDTIHVVDYKHGAGVLVDVRDNPQMAIYAKSMIADLDDMGLHSFEPDTLVRITIVQPRHHAEDSTRTWELTLKDLDDFCRDIEYRAIQIQEGRGLEFKPSEDACRWCACKAFCGAHAEALAAPVAELGGIDFLAELPELDKKEAEAMEPADRIAARAGTTLDDDTLVKLFANGAQLTALLADIAEYLQQRLENGEDIDGVKLVRGREGNRAWADEEEADKVIGRKLKADERYVKKLISPTQAEKLLKDDLEGTRFRNRFEELITRSAAKTVLAPASDKRPAVVASANELPELE